MNKTLLASAIALSLGASATAQAQTITITAMNFSGIYAASGTVNDMGTGVMNSVDDFFYQPWTATQKTWDDTHEVASSWSGDGTNGSVNGSAFSYSYTLTGNQVAVGTFFDWNTNNGIPVLTIYDCPVSGGGACTGASLPMANGPFSGSEPGFNGSTMDDFPVSGGSSVPVPAAVWLMGSGLLGLVGVARRRKVA